MIPSRRPKYLKALHFRFHIVCFQVDMHAFLADFSVISSLEEQPHFRVRKLQLAVDMTATLGDRFFCGTKRR
jgi:hypothetical protein